MVMLADLPYRQAKLNLWTGMCVIALENFTIA